jgi:hypothetical protein
MIRRWWVQFTLHDYWCNHVRCKIARFLEEICVEAVTGQHPVNTTLQLVDDVIGDSDDLDISGLVWPDGREPFARIQGGRVVGIEINFPLRVESSAERRSCRNFLIQDGEVTVLVAACGPGLAGPRRNG